MPTIAGRNVRPNDRLYHATYRAWGKVTCVSNDGQSFSIQLTSDDGRKTTLHADNGDINGRRELFWHNPFLIDLPINDITPVKELMEEIYTFATKHQRAIQRIKDHS